jgi:hypothetical protein
MRPCATSLWSGALSKCSETKEIAVGMGTAQSDPDREGDRTRGLPSRLRSGPIGIGPTHEQSLRRFPSGSIGSIGVGLEEVEC